MSRITLVYDGNCSFCIMWLKRLKRMDPDDVVLLVDSHEPELIERYPQLRSANLDDAMYALDESGSVSEGFDAFRAALSILPPARAWVWTWWIPGVAPVGRIVYRYVARHRHDYGCESRACEINLHE